MANLALRAFSRGEVSPSLYARTDIEAYARGLRTCRNFIPLRGGGIANRPGTRYIEATKNNGYVQLIEFIFSAEQTYVMEFGDQYIRFYQDGGQVAVASVTAWSALTAYAVGALASRLGVNYYCIVAHTNHQPPNNTYWYPLDGDIYEIPTPYLLADLLTTPLQFVQSQDVVTLLHPSYAPRELSRLGNTDWTLGQISFVPTIGSVTNLALGGGNAGTIKYWTVTAVDAGGREGLPVAVSSTNRVPSTAVPTTITWDPVANAAGYRVYYSTDGRTYGFVGVAGGVTVTTTDTAWTTTTSTITTTTSDATLDAPDQCRNALAMSAVARAVDGLYTCKGTLTITSSGGADVTEGYVRAYYSRDAEPRVDAGVIAQVVPALGGDGTISRNFTGTLSVPDNGYAALTIDLVAEVFGTVASGVPTFQVVVNTASAPWNSVTWQVGASGFSDAAGTVDFSQAPPLNQGLFTAPDTYPSVGTYYQQRLVLANTVNAPETVYASRTGDYHNFTLLTPNQDDATVTFTVAGRSVNQVQALLDLGRLLVLTSAGEYTVEGDTSGALTPTGINLRQQLYQGSSTLPPIVVGYAAIYLQSRGSVVRDIVRDLYTGFKSTDLTLWASHLFDGYTITDWAFQLTPGSVLWAVRSDGVLLSLTYLVDQDVLAWAHHDTAGTVESICVVPEGTEDAVYVVVNRTINGATTRGVERLTSRTVTPFTDVRDLFFVDAGSTYDGLNTTARTMTLTGSAWDGSVLVTCTASSAFFGLDPVGQGVFFNDEDGNYQLRCVIEEAVSSTVVHVRPQSTVPVALQGVATTDWTLAVVEVTGLDYLEGEEVSIFADGTVVASPNNYQYDPPTVVTGGVVQLGAPYGRVHVGLPYTSDMETLDIDSPSGPSLKPHKMLINCATLEVQDSRGFFIGGSPPTGDDMLENLDEAKIRDDDDEFDPIALRTTSYVVPIQNRWNNTGRIFVRQVDPVPLTVLAAMPQGSIPPAV